MANTELNTVLLAVGKAQVDAMFRRQEAHAVDDSEFLPLLETVLTAFETTGIEHGNGRGGLGVCLRRIRPSLQGGRAKVDHCGEPGVDAAISLGATGPEAEVTKMNREMGRWGTGDSRIGLAFLGENGRTGESPPPTCQSDEASPLPLFRKLLPQPVRRALLQLAGRQGGLALACRFPRARRGEMGRHRRDLPLHDGRPRSCAASRSTGNTGVRRSSRCGISAAPIW